MEIDELLDLYPVDAVSDFSSAEGIDQYGDAAAARGVRIISAVAHYSCQKQEKLRGLSTQTAVL